LLVRLGCVGRNGKDGFLHLFVGYGAVGVEQELFFQAQWQRFTTVDKNSCTGTERALAAN